MIRCEELIRECDNSYFDLRGVSPGINTGEFAAIMGPSGCGKSPLLNILGLLDRPSSGRCTGKIGGDPENAASGVQKFWDQIA